MTAPTLAKTFAAGGGHYALLFHVAGLPWAVCTDPRIISQLDNPSGDVDARAFRRLLFGQQWILIAGPAAYYPSDDVQIISGLSHDLGTQTVSYDEDRGLSGGAWKVAFKREASGLEASEIRDGGVDGIYDGLDLVPDPTYDGSIGTGMLAVEYREETGMLTWANDAGLYQAIKDRLDNYDVCYLWGLSSCLAVSVDPIDNADGTYSVAAVRVRNGIFRTCRERLFPSDFEGGSLLLSTAPIGGIVGRPANLWMIPTDADGNILDLIQGTGTLGDYPKPWLFRTGFVAPNPRGDASEWKITCRHWLDWLDVEPPTDRPIGQLKGFRLSRQPAGIPNLMQRAHISLIEWNAGSSTYEEKEIWLCAAGGEVYYETIEDLTAAVATELADAIAGISAFSDTLNYSYYIGEYGLVTDTTPAKEGYCSGAIPGILDWNNAVGAWLTSDAYHRAQPVWDVYGTETLDELNNSGYPSPANREGYRLITTATAPWVWKGSTGFRANGYWGRALYYYQYPFARLLHAEFGADYVDGSLGWPPPALDQWPIPKQTTAGDYRLEFQDDFNAQLLSVGSDLTLGYDAGSLPTTLQIRGSVTSVGVGYCITDVADAWDTIPALERSAVSAPYPPWWPMALFYFPHAGLNAVRVDRWPVAQNQPVSSTSLPKLLRGVLGDEETTGADVPNRLRIYHIPDLFNDTAYNEDFRELIDWEALKQLTIGVFTSQELSLPMADDSKLNIWKALNAALLNHRIRPTWGPSEEQRAWIMSFEEFGAPSAIAANTAGRIINASDITKRVPIDTHGGTWLYRDIEGTINYDSEGESLPIKIFNRTGIATQVGGEKTLKIDDKLLHLDESDLGQLITIYRELLAHINVASPTTKLECTSRILPTVTVGSSAIVTSESIWNFLTGARSVSNAAALVTEARISLGVRSFDISTSLRLSPLAAQGWSPAMVLAGANMSLASDTVTVTGLETSPTTAGFADPNGGLTDLAYMGCFIWSAATDEVEENPNCTCGKFAVWIFDRDADTYYTAGANKNVWAAEIMGHTTTTLCLDDVENGRCRIKLLDTVAPFSAGTAKVVKFADRDNASLQSCQVLYGFWGDANGQVEDSAGKIHRAFSWT